MRVGATFAGPVTHVGDSDSLCVRDPRGLVEVRLANFSGPELREPGGEQARNALRSLAGGRRATCRMVRGHNGSWRSHDRAVSRCTVNGRDLGDAMRQAVRQGGNGRGW